MLKINFYVYEDNLKLMFCSYLLKGNGFLDAPLHSATVIKKLRYLQKFLKRVLIYTGEHLEIKKYYKLTKFIRRNLKFFLICDIHELRNFKSFIDGRYSDVVSKFEEISRRKIRKKFDLKRLKDYSEENIRDFINGADEYLYDIYVKIFIKDGYETKINKISYYLVELLSTPTCPYCNINWTYAIKHSKIRPQLDHFFPKSKYPFFAMSLANLIPSCNVCNYKKRESFNDNLQSPFEINSFNDFKFTFIPDIEIKALTEIKLEEIEKNIKEIDFIKEIKANNELFSLKERYQKHKDVVAEIIQKPRLVNYYKEKMDSNVLRIDFPFSEEEYRLIYCNYYPSSEEEFLRRTLSKLTFDIYKELSNIP